MRLMLVLIIGALVFFGIMFFLGLSDTIDTLSKINILYLIPAFIFLILSFLSMSSRWYIVLKRAKIDLSFVDALKISVIGVFFSNITPSARLGGEPLRVWLTNKLAKTATKKSLATVLVERIIDAIALEFLAIVAFLFFFIKAPLLVSTIYVILLIVLTIIVIFILLSSLKPALAKGVGRRILGWAKKIKKIRSRISDAFEEQFFEDILVYNRQVRHLLGLKSAIACLIFSFMMWLFDVLRMLCVFLAFGYNPPLILILSALIVSCLFGGIPFLPGGLGVVESSLIFIYSSAGVPFILSGAITIVDRFISYWIPTFGFGFLTYKSMRGLTWIQSKEKLGN